MSLSKSASIHQS